ncbi:coiled-coil domain-containing protein 160 [Octodon degus]|uniref:Coiled-coil domain-containing protein 160 n=1 Tax=Octodon degus TaxID=10160 RepID=A0A6P6EQM7_OCTDE|nr:coiled-coil domain-containing protein 160 [Octodon degus]XP_023574635.1 coiled-coil domain-containing protein 160 [Octodon degus]
MDDQGKQWKENTFVPHVNGKDIIEEDFQAESSSEQIAVEKTKKMEGNHNFSGSKFQQEKESKEKEYISQLNQRENEPNLREKASNMSKNEAVTNSASCSSYNLDAVSKENFNRAGRLSPWRKEEFPTLSRHSTKKKLTKGISPKLNLYLLNEALEELNIKCRKIEEDFENSEKELLNSKKEGSTKSLNFQETETDTLSEELAIQALKDELSEKETDVKNLTEELQQANELIHKLNLENRCLKQALKKLQCQNELGNALLQEEMQFCYELEVEKLHGELNVIKNELKVEKTLQARNNSALDWLTSVLKSSSTFDHFSGEL